MSAMNTGRAVPTIVDDVSRKMARGAAWMVLFKLSDRIIGFASTLVLARLLVPADFGLIAMAISILAILEMMSAFSFDVALIQNSAAERRHYDTAWTFNVLFGCANALAMIVLSMPAASFYNEPRVAGVMWALSGSSLIGGFVNIGVVAFQKELDLHKEFRLGLAKRLIAFAVTMSLAFLLRTYWALVAGTLASAAAGVALSYRMHPYRPRFSLAGRRELMHFSKWMLLNNLLISLVHRMPDLVIGKVAGPTALGLYGVAYEISNLPTTELVWPISRAVFPGYSRVVREGGELRESFIDVLAAILLVTVPAGIGIMVLAEPLVLLLLGSKWAEAIPLVEVLAIFGLLRASASNMGAVYLALGLPRLLTYLAALQLALLFPALYWLVGVHGAYGAALAAVFSASVQVPVGFAIVCKRLALGFPALAAIAWRPVAAGSIMAGAIIAVRGTWAPGDVGRFAGHALELLTLGAFGTIVYAASIFVLWCCSGCPRTAESKLAAFVGLGFGKLLRQETK